MKKLNTRMQTLAVPLRTSMAESALWRSAGLVLLGTALLAISAHVQVPFWPVKMSMQSFVVLALGAIYGSRLAAITVVVYLIEGAIGLPVFQNGGGLLHFAGPTAGYLMGFVVAAWAVGLFAERGMISSLPTAIGVFLLGDAVIMILGTAWLSNLIGIEKSLSAGLLIFLPGEFLKIGLAVALTRVTGRIGKAR